MSSFRSGSVGVIVAKKSDDKFDGLITRTGSDPVPSGFLMDM
jgi:hypothetical protein